MANVLLAGYNVDSSALAEAVSGNKNPPPLSPETVSAAYARISRDPRPVTRLREDAVEDVARAQRSMSTIVFKFGHHSVAEHASFNFDILNVSRLVVESLESHRLASYTEKSQRYIKLGEDFVVPDEVREIGQENGFRAFVQRCFDRYSALCNGIVDAGTDPKLAGEDARYVLPLATSAQLGMTVNARTLEFMVRRLSANPLAEARDLGRQLLEAGMSIAPSLFLFFEPGPYQLDMASDIEAAVGRLCSEGPEPPTANAVGQDAVRLSHATTDGDARVLAALAQPALGVDFESAIKKILDLDDSGRLDLFRTATRHMTIHDAPPREFEHAYLTFDVVLSAASYGQLKRHRMSSQTPMSYDSALGITVPPAIREAGLHGLLEEAEADSGRMVDALGGSTSPASSYARLNANRRRVLVTMNLREMYHVSRLREDIHAQWDIRAVASDMSRLAREAFPVCASLLGGKDRIDERLCRS